MENAVGTKSFVISRNKRKINKIKYFYTFWVDVIKSSQVINIKNVIYLHTL